MNLTRLIPGMLAVAALTACAATPGSQAAGQQWMVVASAPAANPPASVDEAPVAAGSSEQAGIARQPVMTPGGIMLGGGYAGPLAEPATPKTDQYNALRVRVVGHGAPPVGKDLTLVQRRLLAMRAAQLDAYRAMAEQVQGFKLSGNSAVGNLVATNDSFRVYVDAYLRGVRLLSTDFKPDGSSESIAEVVLDEGFFKAYRTALATTGNVATAARVLPANDGSKLGCTESGCVYGGDFYVSH